VPAFSAFCIIAAGGSGDRLGSSIAKFELPVLGRPMVRFSLEAFEQAGRIAGIVLVVPPDRVDDWAPSRLRASGISKSLATVAGGATRQESVRLGLGAIEGTDDVVVVHDAARPLVTAEIIDAMCDIPAGMAGLVTAVPVTDTIKQAERGSVVKTLDRDEYIAVQTPQSFALTALVEAHREAVRTGFAGTDDSSLVERMGGRVGLMNGSRENIKVTYPVDVVMAEAILKERGKR